jgi:hypothetical protein
VEVSKENTVSIFKERRASLSRVFLNLFHFVAMPHIIICDNKMLPTGLLCSVSQQGSVCSVIHTLIHSKSPEVFVSQLITHFSSRVFSVCTLTGFTPFFNILQNQIYHIDRLSNVFILVLSSYILHAYVIITFRFLASP